MNGSSDYTKDILKNNTTGQTYSVARVPNGALSIYVFVLKTSAICLCNTELVSVRHAYTKSRKSSLSFYFLNNRNKPNRRKKSLPDLCCHKRLFLNGVLVRGLWKSFRIRYKKGFDWAIWTASILTLLIQETYTIWRYNKKKKNVFVGTTGNYRSRRWPDALS